MVKAYIATLAGDGIGPEIMNSGLNVLQAVAEKFGHEFKTEAFPFGGAGIDAAGHPYPEATKKALHEADAILLGAIGGPQYDNAAVTPEKGLLEMRKDLNLFANYRPVSVPDGLTEMSPLKAEIVAGTDIFVVRELTGGVYFGEKVEGTEKATDLMPYTREEVERIAHKAFQVAQTRHKKVTSVDKANVLATSRLWRRVVTEVAEQYPDVELEHALVDATAMKIVTKPTAFDVILTENLFGDILSDESSVLAGSLGMLPSASVGGDINLYEPIHGSAPDIAGKNIANPMSMILSVTMMLRLSFKLFEEADLVEKLAYEMIAEGIKTVDLGGNATTAGFEEELIVRIKGA